MFKAFTGMMAMVAVFWAGTASAFPYVFVPEAGAGTVTVVDAQTNTIVRTIPNLSNAIGVAVNASGTRAYISQGTTSKISVLDPGLIANTGTNPVIGSYTGQGDFHEVAVGPQDATLYVGDTQNDQVSVIDMPNYTLAATYQPATSGLVGFALDPAGRRLALASGTGTTSTVRIYELGTGTYTDVTLPAKPESLLFSSDGNTLWIATATGFETYDLRSGTATPTTVSGGVGAMAYSPRLGVLYVASLSNADVYAYPVAGGTPTTIALSAIPAGLALSPDGTRLYAPRAGGLTVIDTGTDTVATGVGFGTNPAAVGDFVGPGDIYANNTTGTTSVDTQLSGTASASDYQSRPLTYDVISQPGRGTLNFTQSTGDYTYTPPTATTGYSGIQSFVWEAVANTGTGSPTQPSSRPVTATILVDPTMSAFTVQKVDSGTTIGPLSFTLKGTTPLQLAVTSSNHNVVDPATAQFNAGCGTSTMTCTLTLTAGTAKGASANVVVSATDPSGLVAHQTFTVAINGGTSGSGGGGGFPWPILAGFAILLTIVRLRRRADENGSI